MIKPKLKFFSRIKSCRIKSLEVYFSFILELKKKDYMAQKQFNSEKKEKEERKR